MAVNIRESMQVLLPTCPLGLEPGPQAEEAGMLRPGTDCQAQRGHGRGGGGG